MPVHRYTAERYIPTTNRASNDGSGAILIRGKNVFVRGRNGITYAEVYGGSLDLSETIASDALSGAISFSPASRAVSGGLGSDFKAELRLGMRVMTVAGEIIIVSSIESKTSFTAHSLPLGTESNVAAYRLPIIFEMDNKRGTLLAGNALEFDKGTILAVGTGTLRVNGTALTSSLAATKNAKVAIFNESTGQYLIQTLGFSTLPYGIVISAAAAPVATTFTDANVNTGTNEITIAAHGYQTGQEVTLTQAGTLPAPLAKNTRYFVIRVDANTIKLATTRALALAGTAIDITTTGTAGTNTVTPVVKNMPAGDRSLRIAKASTKLGTPSYGNPGEKLKVTLTAGQQIKIDFPAMDSNADSTNPHDAWRIYASPFGGTTAIATANADSGPWYHVRTVSSAELGGTAAASYYLEYLDAEIDGTLRLITFDNDAPPQAEFVATVAGYPVLVSCQGKATTTTTTGTSPGPSIVPFKPSNLAAAPLVLDTGQRNEVPLSPPETILGCYMAAGRLYLMTANTLQIAVFTADQDFPVATRPFWKAGFKSPGALCFVNGRLYGFTSAGATRSVADGEEGSEEHAFAADVEELMKDWEAEKVFVIHDPQNECVCFVYSAGSKNSDGYWITKILPFMLRSEEWSPEIVLTSSTKDSVVSGCATVNGYFEFLMGGRSAGSLVVKTYRFDSVSGESVPYSLAWSFFDGGSEDRLKLVKNPRVVGKVTSATLGIFGAGPGENVDVSQFETGNGASKSGAIAIDTGSGIEYRGREDCIVNGLMTFALQVTGTWAGTGDKDRLDECSIEVLPKGRRT